MRREIFTLAALGERYARFASSMNRSEKTIAWYQGALADYCRYLEGPGGAESPARLEDLTLESVRDYILYLRGRPAFEAHPFRASRKAGLSDASVNSYVRVLRAFTSWLVRAISHRIYPAAAALRTLLDRAYQAALDEVAGIEDHRLQQIHPYLQLVREGKSDVTITKELGLHSRS